ncbi:hypothetical protein F4813DRAFT_387659 [Daldinia decipiens]|uniref:uncharacterized protein n=1 Tax=Daldinia decipiens TaxID=326647 RepID=UPI0020C235A8|nr:uncharacterized protein F4813DRAFT_387659 [Daldinia decipiens]KAI1659553.1 hypothetical protein F4813DRAFT_387659 [Daldinia decipiens]
MDIFEDMAMGDQSLKGQKFCPWKLVRSYPHRLTDLDNREEVIKVFTKLLFENRTWDLFCLLDPSKTGRNPLLLVPSAQFEELLKHVNSHLKLQLDIPEGEIGKNFSVTFGDWDTPLPRFLGRASNSTVLDELVLRIHRLPVDDLAQLSTAALQNYRAKMDNVYGSLKQVKDKAVVKASKRAKSIRRRIRRQKGYGRMTKRAQRYLGLRGLSGYPSSLDITATDWNVDMPVPFKPEGSIRFVSVDIEAWEKSINVITEVGLAILDTQDTINVPPGRDGYRWFPLIKSHHFIIEEHKKKINYKYVQGCPGQFNFGDSKYVGVNEIGRVISKIIGDTESPDQRPVIIVGHAVCQDLTYLKKLGYNIWQAPQFIDEIDTRSMFQHLKKTTSGGGLIALCKSLGMLCSNFHNAGNDATYTLRAMISIAVKQMMSDSGGQKEANSNELEEDEWSDGIMDDGGPPQKSAEWMPKPVHKTKST